MQSQHATELAWFATVGLLLARLSALARFGGLQHWFTVLVLSLEVVGVTYGAVLLFAKQRTVRA